MGANVSTIEDGSNAYVAPPPAAFSHAVSSPFPTSYLHHHQPHYSQNNTINGKYHQPHYHHHQSSNSNHARSKATTGAALVPSYKAAKVHRVIDFHSSPSCRGYLEASKASNTLVVMGFTNDWSECCWYMEPILQELAAKYVNVDFLKINVDQLYDISREFGVQTTPTFLLMKRGRLVDKMNEANKEELQKKIDKHRI